jgi:hypothetical protein
VPLKKFRRVLLAKTTTRASAGGGGVVKREEESQSRPYQSLVVLFFSFFALFLRHFQRKFIIYSLVQIISNIIYACCPCVRLILFPFLFICFV